MEGIGVALEVFRNLSEDRRNLRSITSAFPTAMERALSLLECGLLELNCGRRYAAVLIAFGRALAPTCALEKAIRKTSGEAGNPRG